MTSKIISDKEILNLWRDINFSGSYRGIKSFQILLKTDLNIDISEKRLYNVLKTDSVYLLHAKPKRNYNRRKFDLNYYGELLQGDIAYMFEVDGFKYFILIIDCYSNKIFAKPLKNKTSQSVFEEFQKIYNEINTKVTKFETDQGKEFSLIKNFCVKEKIIYKYKFGKNKARLIIEHFIRLSLFFFSFLKYEL